MLPKMAWGDHVARACFELEHPQPVCPLADVQHTAPRSFLAQPCAPAPRPPGSGSGRARGRPWAARCLEPLFSPGPSGSEVCAAAPSRRSLPASPLWLLRSARLTSSVWGGAHSLGVACRQKARAAVRLIAVLAFAVGVEFPTTCVCPALRKPWLPAVRFPAVTGDVFFQRSHKPESATGGAARGPCFSRRRVSCPSACPVPADGAAAVPLCAGSPPNSPRAGHAGLSPLVGR